MEGGEGEKRRQKEVVIHRRDSDDAGTKKTFLVVGSLQQVVLSGRQE
jgi:hypothetical protein